MKQGRKEVGGQVWDHLGFNNVTEQVLTNVQDRVMASRDRIVDNIKLEIAGYLRRVFLR